MSFNKSFDERIDRLREASGNVVYSDALTNFLYLLMKNELSAGRVEELVLEAVSNTEDRKFNNGWLANYANNLAEELLNAKTTSLTKVLSEAFGGEAGPKTKDNRPSFKSEENTLEERAKEGEKVLDILVKSGQLKAEEAAEILKEMEEFHKTGMDQKHIVNDPINITKTVYVPGGEPMKDGDMVVVDNTNPNLTFEKKE